MNSINLDKTAFIHVGYTLSVSGNQGYSNFTELVTIFVMTHLSHDFRFLKPINFQTPKTPNPIKPQTELDSGTFCFFVSSSVTIGRILKLPTFLSNAS